MTSDRLRWSLLILFVGLMSMVVVIYAGVSVWVAGGILAAWLWIFVRYWPEEGE